MARGRAPPPNMSVRRAGEGREKTGGLFLELRGPSARVGRWGGLMNRAVVEESGTRSGKGDAGDGCEMGS